MKFIKCIIATAITIGLIICLNKKWGTIPPIAKFLSPQQGFWQNAESQNESFNNEISIPGLEAEATVYFDEHLIPHVFAQNETDVYFVQGYLHAKFRLFQMELQTLAAAGRASEIAGEKAIDFDKTKRRLGMVYAAENSLAAMENNATTKAVLDAYTSGVNAYIQSLHESELPIEYKLLDFKPEKWSNLKSALLLKMMAEMLASGTENDLSFSLLKNSFNNKQLQIICPEITDSLTPIIPSETAFKKPDILPKAPASADSLYFKNNNDTVSANEPYKPDRDNGSNNWVVGPTKTQSGAPILCNDPHLELSLPSIWYQMQITTPQQNSSGVSIPGSPYIIIGFNDSIAWGVTNAQRDVKDYYAITFKDKSHKEYWYNNAWETTKFRIEQIKVRGTAAVYDTVAYTIFGPLIKDAIHEGDSLQQEKGLAVHWIAHEASNEPLALHLLNRATNYEQYENAIQHFKCPAQNFVFAAKNGDIAIWQQGLFPLRWQGQGLYIMPGTDSSYAWQGYIPQNENPHILNPAQGYLTSANQRPVAAAYPYFIPGDYINDRATRINEVLAKKQNITVTDMEALQNDYFNITAQDALPIMLKKMQLDSLSETEINILNEVKEWDYYAMPGAVGQTIYQHWFDTLVTVIFDEIAAIKGIDYLPDYRTVAELIIRDSTNKFYDIKETTRKESLAHCINLAFKKATIPLQQLVKENKLEWSKFKGFTIYHLLKPLQAFARKNMETGGYGNIVNAIKNSHGPSWRMIVELTGTTQAYGIYPAGQSGNPGSKYYDSFINTWLQGKYLPIWVMEASDVKNKYIKWVMHFKKAA